MADSLKDALKKDADLSLTSVTGFLFPFTQFLPSHGVAIVSLLVLAAFDAVGWTAFARARKA